MGFEPLAQRSVHSCLPAGAGGSEGGENVAIEPNGGSLLVASDWAPALLTIRSNS